jgi:hypothetical protein
MYRKRYPLPWGIFFNKERGAFSRGREVRRGTPQCPEIFSHRREEQIARERVTRERSYLVPEILGPGGRQRFQGRSGL